MAGKIIEINSLYKKVHDYCKEYSCVCEPDITVSITQADIDYERKKSAAADTAEGRTPHVSPDDYLEVLVPRALSTSAAKSRLCSRWAFCIKLKNMNDSGSDGSKPWYFVV